MLDSPALFVCPPIGSFLQACTMRAEETHLRNDDSTIWLRE
jgi:hypothetical protein